MLKNMVKKRKKLGPFILTVLLLFLVTFSSIVLTTTAQTDDVEDSITNTEEGPVADFSADVTSGEVPLTVSFIDESTGSPTEWKWNFGDGSDIIDGNTSDYQNPTHTYSKPGNYTVKETVINAVDRRNTTEKINYIIVPSSTVTSSKSDIDEKDMETSSPAKIQSINNGIEDSTTTTEKLVTDFSADIASGNAPLEVQFIDKSTGNPTEWKWNFGDGSDIIDGNTSDYQNPTHTYSKPGNYTVKETAINSVDRNTAEKTSYITVTSSTINTAGTDISTFKTAGSVPVAKFFASKSENEPLTIVFTDTSTGSPTEWHWYFGDGTTSTEKNPTHTYSKPGNYAVSLTVRNPDETATGADNSAKTQIINTTSITTTNNIDNINNPTNTSTSTISTMSTNNPTNTSSSTSTNNPTNTSTRINSNEGNNINSYNKDSNVNSNNNNSNINSKNNNSENKINSNSNNDNSENSNHGPSSLFYIAGIITTVGTVAVAYIKKGKNK
jgi:FOG: PKD repeat